VTVHHWLSRARRRWFAAQPDRRRRLGVPVVSVGNLTFGGSGKTPVAGHLARLLLDMGERPSILSRGYGRADPVDGVVVVRDADCIRSELPRAGDEPLMLARRLDKALVLVSPDRALAGRLAERHLGATVHVLDDGFQHLRLWRDVDLLVVAEGDLDEPPSRLREPLAMAAAADAVLVTCARDEDARVVADRLAVGQAFRVARRPGAPRLLDGSPAAVPEGAPVVAFAGIARPQRFFEAVAAQGFAVRDVIAFRDHHAYGPADLARIGRAVATLGAEGALTTEKDAVRLLPMRPLAVSVAWIPLSIAVEPASAFRSWLSDRLDEARRAARAAA
jgi:tetraacyldisaccharide 4'-kinase